MRTLTPWAWDDNNTDAEKIIYCSFVAPGLQPGPPHTAPPPAIPRQAPMLTNGGPSEADKRGSFRDGR